MCAMKKLVLICAILCGMFTVYGAELSAKGWVNSRQQGKFEFKNSGQYPISLVCSEASAGTVVKGVGVWGRFMRHEVVENGKNYEIKFTYKLTTETNSELYFWLRGAKLYSRVFKAAAESRTVAYKFTAGSDKLSIYFNLMKAPGTLEIISVELNKLD